MHTITIAGDERTARSISRYFMLAEQPRRRPWDRDSADRHAAKYETISYSSALRRLQGRHPQDLRIVVGCDYLRCHTGAPGNLTDVWDAIQRLKSLGAQVVFK